MEPQIIDFYNEYPNIINVIDKMNEEYEILKLDHEILNNKYNIIQSRKKIDKYKIPYKISESLQEYYDYKYKIDFEFRFILKDILEEDETGILAICGDVEETTDINIDKLKRGLFINQYRKYSLIDEIINAFDNLTDNINKKWCKTRVHTIFDVLYMNNTTYSNYEEMIDDIIQYFFSDNSKFLPDKYNELCHKITFEPDNKPDSIICNLDLLLNYMKCSKCNKLHNDNIQDNLCYKCEQD